MSKEPPEGHKDPPFRKFLRRGVGTPVVRWQEILLLGATGFAVTLVLALTVLALRDVKWQLATARDAPAVVPASPNGMAPDRERVADVSLLSPQAFIERTSFRRSAVLEPPFEPMEAKVFKNEELAVLLGGIEGPTALSVCQDEEKALWACGLQARSALYNLVRHTQVRCEPFALDGAGQVNYGGLTPNICFARGLNVAVELVRAGFARPVGFRDRAMEAAETEARTSGNGLWRGGWRIVR